MKKKKKKKNMQMAKYGEKGTEALQNKLGLEKYKKHMKRLANKRWKKHNEQRSTAYKIAKNIKENK